MATFCLRGRDRSPSGSWQTAGAGRGVDADFLIAVLLPGIVLDHARALEQETGLRVQDGPRRTKTKE